MTGDRERSGPPTSEQSKAGVVRVTDELVPELADFYRKTWDPKATEDSVRRARAELAAANPHGAGTDVPTFLFMLDGRPIGHLTTIPVKLWRGGAEHAAHWMKGFMVLPEHRNGPVGFLLVKEALASLGTCLCLTVQPASRRLFEKMGFRNLGTLPNAIRLLNPTKVLRNADLEAFGASSLSPWIRWPLALARGKAGAAVLGAAAGAGMACLAALRGRTSARLSIQTDGVPDAGEIDTLWERVRPSLAAAPVRDAQYLLGRYGDLHAYRFIQLRNGSGLAGVGVIRAPGEGEDPRLRGVRISMLSDLVCPPEDPALALAILAAAERRARAMGADALLFSASHDALKRLPQRRMFVALPGTVHFLCRSAEGSEPEPPPLGQWWLTRGDSFADGVQ